MDLSCWTIILYSFILRVIYQERHIRKITGTSVPARDTFHHPCFPLGTHAWLLTCYDPTFLVVCGKNGTQCEPYALLELRSHL